MRLPGIWFCRYPRPQMKAEFMEICRNYGLKGIPVSKYIPHSNGIFEWTYLVISNMLQTSEHDKNYGPLIMPVIYQCAASWAIHNTYHMTLQATPGQLVFGRDINLLIPFRTVWARLELWKQGLIKKGILYMKMPQEYHVNTRLET